MPMKTDAAAGRARRRRPACLLSMPTAAFMNGAQPEEAENAADSEPSNLRMRQAILRRMAERKAARDQPQDQKLDQAAMEKLPPEELAEHMWTDLKQPGREAELKEAEAILEKKTEQPPPAHPKDDAADDEWRS